MIRIVIDGLFIANLNISLISTLYKIYLRDGADAYADALKLHLEEALAGHVELGSPVEDAVLTRIGSRLLGHVTGVKRIAVIGITDIVHPLPN